MALSVLEEARQAKQIGKSLEARLTLSGHGALIETAQAHREALRELLNVSQLDIVTAGAELPRFTVSRAHGQKCERCWHWETDVGAVPAHPTLCGRCVTAVGPACVSSFN
jgi:isoleucyl-tRNA synthetase